jgi:hypothetical protein
MTWQKETFKGKTGFTNDNSTPYWDILPRLPEGSLNVLWIVLDDVGYGNLSCFGAPIDTPSIDRLAKNGLRYTNMHTTALCAPTRLPAHWTKPSHLRHGHDLGAIQRLSGV